jgi:hypothetical protein
MTDKGSEQKVFGLVAAQQLVAEQFVDGYMANIAVSPDDANYTKLRQRVAHLVAEVMVMTLKNAPKG